MRLVRLEEPRLKLATAVPEVWLEIIQLIPAINVALLPTPVQSSTLTGTRFAFLTTPVVFPAIIPATCVPCPKQSSVVGSVVGKAEKPLNTREDPFVWNSAWVDLIPESTT